MNARIGIRVNGRQHEIAERATLAALVSELQLDPRYLVVEWNGEALGYAAVSQRELRAGDRLELVRPVAGG